MIQSAIAAAEEAIFLLELRIDRAIGRSARLAIGRYLSVVVIGVPIAWSVTGFHWTRDSAYGLLAGIVLYAAIDIVRLILSWKHYR